MVISYLQISRIQNETAKPRNNCDTSSQQWSAERRTAPQTQSFTASPAQKQGETTERLADLPRIGKHNRATIALPKAQTVNSHLSGPGWLRQHLLYRTAVARRKRPRLYRSLRAVKVSSLRCGPPLPLLTVLAPLGILLLRFACAKLAHDR